MSTKTLAAIILVIGLSALIFLSSNPMINNRYQPQVTSATTDNGSSTPAAQSSRLAALSQENLPTLSEKLSELQTETILESNSDNTRTVQNGDSISVNYTGWLASDGTVFDSSLNPGRSPFSFTVGSGVIDGWSLGVVGMKVGEVRRLKIPSDLGYGEFSQGSIPANADLIFDVELLSFN